MGAAFFVEFRPLRLRIIPILHPESFTKFVPLSIHFVDFVLGFGLFGGFGLRQLFHRQLLLILQLHQLQLFFLFLFLFIFLSLEDFFAAFFKLFFLLLFLGKHLLLLLNLQLIDVFSIIIFVSFEFYVDVVVLRSYRRLPNIRIHINKPKHITIPMFHFAFEHHQSWNLL